MAQRQPTPHRVTVTEYRLMGERGVLHPDLRVELIDGEIIDMAPIGSPHAAIVERVAELLRRTVADHAMVRTQHPVTLDGYSEPQPDVAVVVPRADGYYGSHPSPTEVLLLVEVADSSLPYDSEKKAPLYARRGIPEVWVIDIGRRRITRHRGPSGGHYASVADVDADKPVALAALPTVEIDLSRLFAGLPSVE